MKVSLTTIGSATEDTFLVSNDIMVIDNHERDITCEKLIAFEYGAKLPTEYFESHVGGTAVNVAVGLARQGIETAVCSVIGNDNAGRNVLQVLEGEGVDTELINVNRKNKTDRSLIIIDNKTKERTIFVHKDAGKETEQDFLRINTDCIYLSSLKYNWQKTFNIVIKLAKKKNKRIFFTPGVLQVRAGMNKLKNFMKVVEVIFLNLDEAIEFSLAKIKNKEIDFQKDSKNIEKLAKIIASTGPKVVVITAGSAGAYIYHKGLKHFKPKPVQIQDITGAGDAFASGFLAKYLQGETIEKASRNAILNSSSVIAEVGTLVGLRQF
ncbi:MAG: hypothetical protein GF332_02560 [Candidatus Moranbacteria bacterium]|nr:hypothetical protein [Candidatus Moranbacteria bacterium]